MEDQVMQGTSFIHVDEVGVKAKIEQTFYLVNAEFFCVLYDFDKGHLVFDSAEVYFTFVLS
jgi:hypothetical protein